MKRLLLNDRNGYALTPSRVPINPRVQIDPRATVNPSPKRQRGVASPVMGAGIVRSVWGVEGFQSESGAASRRPVACARGSDRCATSESPPVACARGSDDYAVTVRRRVISAAPVIALSLVALLAVPAFAQSGGTYDLTWNTLDGGGGASAGGTYLVRGTTGQADAGKHTGGTYTVSGGFWFGGSAAPPGGAAPLTAPFPHDRRKNRYISFDPNKAGNDGTSVAFKVELTAITLGSCNGAAGDPAEVDFCRVDRGADDCNTCAGAAAENSCINQAIDCVTGTCTPTGETCVNDAPNAGGSNVGTVWWVGPVQGAGHLLVSLPFRMESTAWENPVHAGDCEVVPEAIYGIRAVDAGSGSESAELLVETTRFAVSSSSWWADCVGQLKKFCGGDIRTSECIDNGDCTAPETCDRAWTLPDGSVNFDDVAAALALVAPGATSVAPDLTWVDLRGPVQASDPPNGIANFPDIGQIISAFGGFPYKGYDPADCPDVGARP